MNVYVIAKDGSEFLDTPVFHAGTEKDEEAIAIFSERESARDYIDAAGWSHDYSVGELRPIQLLQWFEVAHQDGVDMVVVNPQRDWQLFGDRQDVIALDDPRGAFSELVRTRLIGAAA